MAGGTGMDRESGIDLHLADKVPNPMHTLFVGINPAIRSAQVGHYYAHPSNSFWKLVGDSGLAPRPVTAADDDWLVSNGFGFTDVAKRPTARASDLENQEFLEARSRLERLVRDRKPKTVVFVSKRSARAFLESGPADEIRYGPQADSFHGASVWFVPSTSGQSFADTTYPEKLKVFRRLAAHVHTYHKWPGVKWGSSSSRAFLEWAKQRCLLIFRRSDPS